MWKKIDTKAMEPNVYGGRKGVLIRAFNNGTYGKYTSDVVHSWWQPDLKRWARWNHNFEPTHYMEIPTEFEE